MSTLHRNERNPRTKVAIGNLTRLTESRGPSETMADRTKSDFNTKSNDTELKRLKLTSVDAVIIVLGQTGAGKSYFIRAATDDSSIKIGDTLKSVTDKLNAYRTEIDGQPVVVVDSIGFGNTYRSDTEVLREISTWLAEIYIEKVHLAGVLYMHDIRNPWFPGSARKNLHVFEKLVGEAALSNTVLVTTKWETIKIKVHERRLKELTEHRWGDMIQMGSTVERFSGTSQDARRILKSVLNIRRSTILNIQQELVDRQLELSETEAGQTLLKEINKLHSGHMREMAELRTEMNKASDSKDVEMYELLAHHQSDRKSRLKVYQDQISDLKFQNSALEDFRRLHREELRRVEDSLEDRLAFLEEQNLPPPPLYNEAQVQGDDDVQTNSATLSQAAVSAGYRRLEWKCTCGELLYGDFRDATPGSLDKLAARLKEHSGNGSKQGASTSLQIPTKAPLGHSTSRVGWKMPGGGGNSNLNDRATARGASNLNVQQRQALQLCIETGKFTLELSELDLKRPHSDGFLFGRIRERYEEASRSILPMRLRFRKPDKAIFLKFRLGRRPFVSPIAGTIDIPSIPSEQEVTAGNYRYLPCPIDEPIMDNRTFFHHFYAPASIHPDMMWGTRLPWKIGPGLAPMAHGWGIHLEEHPDWPLFAALMFFFMLFSGLVAGIYSWRTGDNQTGVAIGAWLTAVQSMGMTALFFWWT